MIRKVLILFLVVTHAVSDLCVKYTFEDNEWLIDDRGACMSLPFWIVREYSNLELSGQNERSTSFITPLPVLSCVSSFKFSMNLGGTIEVNIYKDSTNPFDMIVVMANMVDITGGDRVTGMVIQSVSDPSYVTGWRTLTMNLTGSDIYDGYISIMGMASPNSTVLVDSFRYIPPGMDESECQLYEDDPIVNHPRAKYARGVKHFRA